MREMFLVRLVDCKVSKIMKRKLSKQDVVLNSIKASAEQLEKKISLVENRKRLPEKINGKLKKKYAAQNTLVGKKCGKAGTKRFYSFY